MGLAGVATRENCDRVHSRLSVSALSSLEWAFAQDIAFYQEAGFRQVSLSVPKLERDGVDLVQAARALGEVGIAVDTVFPSGQLALGEPDGSQTRRLLAEVGLTAEIGARAMCVTHGSARGRSFEWARDRFLERIEPVVAEAERLGVIVILEGTRPQFAHLSFVHTFRDSVALARETGAHVVFDTVHFWWEPGLETQVTESVDVLALVQVGDLAFDGPVTERAIPGAGDLRLEQMLSWTQAAACCLPIEIEVLGPTVQRMPPSDVIGASAQHLGAILRRLDQADPDIASPR
jgi:sugar phosphate isomerase/epimerase